MPLPSGIIYANVGTLCFQGGVVLGVVLGSFVVGYFLFLLVEIVTR